MLYMIKGAPIPWQRAGRCGTRYYDTQKHWKASYAITMSSQHGTLPKYTKPLHIEAMFYFPIPNYLKAPTNPNSKKPHKKEGMPVPIKPDLDNCIKFILDACNKVLWDDDCIVCSITMKKVYSKNPRTEFTITELLCN